jgi:hypothetical protein
VGINPNAVLKQRELYLRFNLQKGQGDSKKKITGDITETGPYKDIPGI